MRTVQQNRREYGLTAAILSVVALMAPIPAIGQVQVPPAPYFALQTAELQGHGKCLEANRLDPNSVLKGETFMDRCQPVLGQVWTAQPLGEGRFHLKSRLYGASRCLAINAGGADTLPEGAPFMAPCAEEVAVFDTVGDDGQGQYFTLRTRHDGREVCLASRVGAGSTDAFVPVRTIPCAGTEDQLWTLADGGLVDGVPTANAGDARQPRGIGPRRLEGVRQAECLWNDGTGDRSEYYACTVERLDRTGSFVVTGGDRVHEFMVRRDRPDIAYGFMLWDGASIPLGRFQRRPDDPACWVNASSGERLCFW